MKQNILWALMVLCMLFAIIFFAFSIGDCAEPAGVLTVLPGTTNTLKWDSPAPGDEVVKTYMLRKKEPDGEYSVIHEVKQPDSTVVVVAPAENGIYSYAAEFENTQNVKSDHSNAVQIKTLDKPGKPVLRISLEINLTTE